MLQVICRALWRGAVAVLAVLWKYVLAPVLQAMAATVARWLRQLLPFLLVGLVVLVIGGQSPAVFNELLPIWAAIGIMIFICSYIFRKMRGGHQNRRRT